MKCMRLTQDGLGVLVNPMQFVMVKPDTGKNSRAKAEVHLVGDKVLHVDQTAGQVDTEFQASTQIIAITDA